MALLTSPGLLSKFWNNWSKRNLFQVWWGYVWVPRVGRPVEEPVQRVSHQRDVRVLPGRIHLFSFSFYVLTLSLRSTTLRGNILRVRKEMFSLEKHLWSWVDRLQRRLLPLTSSPPRGDKLWGRGGAFSFLSLFFLRMLCVWGFGWYWVLGVGPTGYTESRPDQNSAGNPETLRPAFCWQTHRGTAGGESAEKFCGSLKEAEKKRKWQFAISHNSILKHKFVSFPLTVFFTQLDYLNLLTVWFDSSYLIPNSKLINPLMFYVYMTCMSTSLFLYE